MVILQIIQHDSSGEGTRIVVFARFFYSIVKDESENPKLAKYKDEENPNNPSTNVSLMLVFFRIWAQSSSSSNDRVVAEELLQWRPRQHGRGCKSLDVPEDRKFFKRNARKNKYYKFHDYSHLSILPNRAHLSPKMYNVIRTIFAATQ